MPNLRISSALPAAAAALLAACVSQITTEPSGVAASGTPLDARSAGPDARNGAAHADAILRDATGATVGTAHFTEDGPGRVHVVLQVRGLAPGRHGLHLHMVGACDPGKGAAFASAGAHHNPGGRQHGRHSPLGYHAGDLPNVAVNGAGSGRLVAALVQFDLASLADADGTALVLHQNEDDERTNAGPLGPGNSGPRIACGVVEAR